MKRVTRAFIIACLILPAAGRLFAATLSLDDLLARMEKAEKNIRGLKFDFEQDTVYSLTNEKQTNGGEVVFQKPNKIYLRQNNPLQQTIVTNGDKVWIYTPSYQQVVVDSWKKWTSNSMVPPSMLTLGNTVGDLRKRFILTYAGQVERAHVLLLTPRAKEGWELKLWIDDEQYIPVRASINAGNVSVTTTVKNYTVNPRIEKDLFSFKTPAGAEVLNVP